MAHILVVDDEEGLRDFLTEALEDDGHSTEKAADGMEAAALLPERPSPFLSSGALLSTRPRGRIFRPEYPIDSRTQLFPVMVGVVAWHLASLSQ